MEVLEKGHIYRPAIRKIPGGTTYLDVGGIKPQQTITFINKEPGREHDGTTTQEVLRILLDRTRHCNNCLPHRNNEQVIYHLRMALVLHEARALERKMEKGDYLPEYVPVGDDGHFRLPMENEAGNLDTTYLIPHRNDWDRECNHPPVLSTDTAPARVPNQAMRKAGSASISAISRADESEAMAARHVS